MEKKKIIKEFVSRVKELSESKKSVLYYWTLGVDCRNNRWAIVLGWQDGYDKSNDKYADGTFRLCAKLAYQPVNSAMQSDFDVDWIMPCDESGEVDDTTTAFYGEYGYGAIGSVAEWYMNKFDECMVKIAVEELKSDENYWFSCSLGDDEIGKDNDEWGVAEIMFGKIGVEYNYCVQSGSNYSAIYKMEENEETEFFETDTDTFVHYEINPENKNWRDDLENAMCKALIEMFGLKY